MSMDVFNVGGRRSRAAGDGRPPLSGRAFFLDVRGSTRILEDDLQSLKGKVERFLSKDLDYVITNRGRSSPRKTKVSPRRSARSGEYSRGKAMVSRSTQNQQAEVRSYAVGVATKWGIEVRDLEDVKDWIAKQKEATVGSRPSSGRKTAARSRQLSQNQFKVEDKSGQYQPVVRWPTRWPKLDFTPSSGSPFASDMASPPRTRSAGRKTNTRSRLSGTVSPVKTTRQTRSATAAAKGSPAASTVKPSPRSRQTPVAKGTKPQYVYFDIAKIPPASESIPKPKILKKGNVTMKKVKRQLDFGDIAPTPPRSSNTKVMRTAKKLTILRELQDRLDDINDRSPVKVAPIAVKQQPARRGKNVKTSPKNITVARLAKQLKSQLREDSAQLTPMALRNGKVKFAAY